jgi:hypothetical protein
MMVTEQEIRSLIALMSDTDPVVADAVTRKVISMSREDIARIKMIINTGYTSKEVEYLEKILAEGDRMHTESLIREYLKERDPILSTGVFLVTRLADHTVEPDNFNRTLRMLADEISFEMSDQMSAVEKVEIFNHILFKRMGFEFASRGTKPSENDTLVNRVLELRAANYISIALIYFMIAREVGLPVYPLWAQKGFFPVYISPDSRMLFYLNMAYNFEILTREAIKDFIEDIESTYGKDALVVEKDLLLVSIYVQVLADIYAEMGDSGRSESFERVLEEFGGRKSFGE